MSLCNKIHHIHTPTYIQTTYYDPYTHHTLHQHQSIPKVNYIDNFFCLNVVATSFMRCKITFVSITLYYKNHYRQPAFAILQNYSLCFTFI